MWGPVYHICLRRLITLNLGTPPFGSGDMTSMIYYYTGSPFFALYLDVYMNIINK